MTKPCALRVVLENMGRLNILDGQLEHLHLAPLSTLVDTSLSCHSRAMQGLPSGLSGSTSGDATK
eukprot:15438651-Alexandrium_andersonii.AAC.1